MSVRPGGSITGVPLQALRSIPSEYEAKRIEFLKKEKAVQAIICAACIFNLSRKK